MMLPTNEIDTLTMTVVDAIEFAADGKVADGNDALPSGLERKTEPSKDSFGVSYNFLARLDSRRRQWNTCSGSSAG